MRVDEFNALSMKHESMVTQSISNKAIMVAVTVVDISNDWVAEVGHVAS